jgi:Tfp pilus assembly PilM family ATPase
MVFSNKAKGYFVEHNSHSVLLASTSAHTSPMVVEELLSCASGSADALTEAVKQLHPKKSGQHGYMRATCGVYSNNRLVRHVSLDPKRYKEAAYMDDVLANQIRVEADKYTMALLGAGDGMDFDFSDATKKDAIVVGMQNDEVIGFQNTLLQHGIYPERLEVCTLATLGGIVDYLKFNQIKTPTLVLEIDTDSTQSFIVSDSGVENSRPISQGLEAMIPAVQKEIGLKDPEAARKLFYSNAFDFTGMGPVLIKKLLKELQSSVGFYEVQTGQSIGQVICTLLPPKLSWLENAISSQLGVAVLTVDYPKWLQARGLTLGEAAKKQELNNRWLGLFSLMLTHNHAVTA